MKSQTDCEKVSPEQILSHLPTGIVVYDLTGDVVTAPYMGDGYYQMLGTTREERAKVQGGNVLQAVHPEDAPGLLAEAQAAVREKRMVDYRYRILTGKGDYIWVGLRANHIPLNAGTERFFAVFYDIDMLVQEKDHGSVLNAILGNIPGGVAVFSEVNGCFHNQYANDGLYEIHHGSPKYWLLYDSDPLNWLYKDDINVFKAEFMAVERGLKPRGTVTYRVTGQDGKLHWVRMDFRRAYSLHDVQYYYASFVDMDEEMAAIEAMRTATAANKAKTEFLSRMSHDIRTPLNGIIGMTYLAKDQANPAKTNECLQKIDTSSKFLLGLVNDILDLTRIESNRLDLHLEPYTAQEFSSYMEAVIRPLCDEKGQQLTFDIHVPSDYYILQDKLYINRIVFNLLSNAVKYTPEGGKISYVVSAHVLPDKKKMAMHIEIADNGIGISDSFQKVMFDPFSQANRDDNSQTNGHGLGLSIVKKMLAAMNGTIAVRSKPGCGTTFIIDLLNDCVPAASVREQAPRKAATFANLRGKHVLVCDDHPLNRQILAALLAKQGMVVDTAEDGQHALDTIEVVPVDHYAAILMDVRMPVMDGLTATAMIRALPRPDAVKVPIIAVTANAYAQDIKECLEAGMNDHLGKPIEPEKLYSTLAKYIR
jgi:PAS domain S-box-containing protein